MSRSWGEKSECDVRFFVDSGAGQCMCSCVEAFSSIRACAIIVVGVSGSLPIHGVGTAFFLVLDSLGEEIVIRIHNCLLCETTSEEDTFNLISVSQLLRSKRNSVQFQSQQSTITLSHPRRTSDVILNLVPDCQIPCILSTSTSA